MLPDTSGYLTGLVNSHARKNGRFFSAMAFQESVKTFPTLFSHEVSCQNYQISLGFFNIATFTQLSLPRPSLCRYYHSSVIEIESSGKEHRDLGQSMRAIRKVWS